MKKTRQPKETATNSDAPAVGGPPANPATGYDADTIALATIAAAMMPRLRSLEERRGSLGDLAEEFDRQRKRLLAGLSPVEVLAEEAVKRGRILLAAAAGKLPAVEPMTEEQMDDYIKSPNATPEDLNSLREQVLAKGEPPPEIVLDEELAGLWRQCGGTAPGTIISIKEFLVLALPKSRLADRESLWTEWMREQEKLHDHKNAVRIERDEDAEKWPFDEPTSISKAFFERYLTEFHDFVKRYNNRRRQARRRQKKGPSTGQKKAPGN